MISPMKYVEMIFAKNPEVKEFLYRSILQNAKVTKTTYNPNLTSYKAVNPFTNEIKYISLNGKNETIRQISKNSGTGIMGYIKRKLINIEQKGIEQKTKIINMPNRQTAINYNGGNYKKPLYVDSKDRQGIELICESTRDYAGVPVVNYKNKRTVGVIQLPVTDRTKI